MFQHSWEIGAELRSGRKGANWGCAPSKNECSGHLFTRRCVEDMEGRIGGELCNVLFIRSCCCPLVNDGLIDYELGEK